MIIVLVGLSGSGKSTWADQWQKKSGGIVVERDRYREMYPAADEKFLTKLEKDAITAAVNRNYHVCVSDTNLRLSRVRELVEDHIVAGVPVTVNRFGDLGTRELIARKPDMADVIRRQAKTYSLGSSWWKDEDLFGVDLVEIDETLPDCAIVDIDGTLALMGDRDPFDYHRAMDDDLNAAVATVVAALKDGRLGIVVATGRPAEFADDLKTWLAWHGVQVDEIHHRPTNDHRSDRIVKKEMLRDIASRWYPVLVLDDRNAPVDMWRAHGIPTFQVAYGDF